MCIDSDWRDTGGIWRLEIECWEVFADKFGGWNYQMERCR